MAEFKHKNYSVAYQTFFKSIQSMLSTPGACYVAAYFGGFLGNLLASACLGIDAWWLGFPILSLCHVVPTVMLMRCVGFVILNVRNGQQNI